LPTHLASCATNALAKMHPPSANNGRGAPPRSVSAPRRPATGARNKTPPRTGNSGLRNQVQALEQLAQLFSAVEQGLAQNDGQRGASVTRASSQPRPAAAPADRASTGRLGASDYPGVSLLPPASLPSTAPVPTSSGLSIPLLGPETLRGPSPIGARPLVSPNSPLRSLVPDFYPRPDYNSPPAYQPPRQAFNLPTEPVAQVPPAQLPRPPPTAITSQEPVPPLPHTSPPEARPSPPSRDATPRSEKEAEKSLKVLRAAEAGTKVSPSKVRCWHRLFGKHLNRQFGEDLEVAVRGAFFVLLLSLPLMMPQKSLGLGRILKHRLYQSETVLYIVYSLSRTVGETVYLICCGFVGVGLCLLNVTMMYHLMPEASENSHQQALILAAVNGMIFVAFLLGLNFNINAAIYGCSFFSVYWMEFLRLPTEEHPRLIPNTFNEALEEMSSCLVGSFFCFLCVMLPYPLWAVQQAQETSQEVVAAISTIWLHMIDFYCDTDRQSLAPDHCRGGRMEDVVFTTSLARELREVEDRLARLENYLDNSWWECLLSRRWWASRHMLTHVQSALKESLDRALCVRQCCLNEKFEAQHMQIMAQVGGSMRALAVESTNLLGLIIEVAVDGVVSEVETEELKQKQVALDVCCRNLTNCYRQALNEAGLPGISYELLEENSFCFSVCTFARICDECGDAICDYAHGRAAGHRIGSISRSLKWLWKHSIMRIVDLKTILEPSHLRFALRNWIAICFSMAVGFRGLESVLSPFDAGIASVCALLLNKSGGSALAKNFARIQGVVIGTVVGQMAYAIFARCTVVHLTALSVLLFVLTALSFFIYFHSESYSFVYFGFMLATFITTNIVASPCSDEGFTSKGVVFDKVVYVIFAMLIILLVDLLLAPASASFLAKQELVKAWEHIDATLKDLCDPKCRNFHFAGEKIEGCLQRAEALSKEAHNEPRYWRPPWRFELFSDASRATAKVRYSLTSLRYSLLAGAACDHHMVRTRQSATGLTLVSFSKLGRSGEVEKPNFLKHVIEVPGFGGLRELLQAEIALTQGLLEVFSHDGQEPIEELSRAGLLRWTARVGRWEQYVEGLVRSELSALEREYDPKEKANDATLEEDYCALVSITVMTINTVMDAMADFRRAAMLF